MKKKIRKTSPRDRRSRKRGTPWLPAGLFFGSLALIVGFVFFVNRAEPWGLPAAPQIPRPATLSPNLFTGKVREVYRIAREVPELLEQTPCYCGCYVSDRHQNNLDCYADRHSVGWRICQDITLDAYKMYKQGRKIEDIKKSIDEKYSRYWPYEKKWPLY